MLLPLVIKSSKIFYNGWEILLRCEAGGEGPRGGGWSAGISVLLLVVKLVYSLLSLSYYFSCRLMMMQIRTDQKVLVPV